MIISSKDNSTVKWLIKLFNDKKTREEEGLYIVEGYHLVEEANKAHVLEHVYSIRDENLYDNCTIITPEIMKKITDTINPQGIIGIVKKNNNSNIGNRVLYLDRVSDPGNIGTLLRSSLAFNFDTIVLDECCDIYNPKVVRSSEGAIFNLNFSKVSLNELKNDYVIIGTSMFGKNANEFNFKSYDKLVLVLGNEGQGVREEYKLLYDHDLTIPMNKVESLNVGVAGSILMYEIEKR